MASYLCYRTEFNNPFGVSFIRYTYLCRVVSLIKLFLSCDRHALSNYTLFLLLYY